MEDEVHLRTVFCTDCKETTVALVEVIQSRLRSTESVVVCTWRCCPLELPLRVEVVGRRVEAGVTTCSTVGYIPLEEVLITVVVVGHLPVVITLRTVVTSRVNIRLKDGELLCSSCVCDIVDKEPVCVALRRCATGRRRWVISDVRTVASRVQVLELPVVFDVVTGTQVRRGSLESTLCRCRGAGLYCGSTNRGPCSIVDAVEHFDSVGGCRIDS